MDLSRRVDELEWMDTRRVPLPVMKTTLSFLETTNRFFGGTNVVLRHLNDWSRNWKKGGTVHILDIGSGGAEIPRAIAAWAGRNGWDVRVTAIDIVDEIVEIASQKTKKFPNVSVQKADFFDLHEKGETFDYAVASLLLHHIRPADSIRFLRALDQVARRGILISDLHRSRSGYWAVTLLSRLIGNSIVRHDGPLSVRRAFRVAELEQLAATAGLSYLQARLEQWHRISLAGEKPA